MKYNRCKSATRRWFHQKNLRSHTPECMSRKVSQGLEKSAKVLTSPDFAGFLRTQLMPPAVLRGRSGEITGLKSLYCRPDRIRTQRVNSFKSIFHMLAIPPMAIGGSFKSEMNHLKRIGGMPLQSRQSAVEQIEQPCFIWDSRGTLM